MSPYALFLLIISALVLAGTWVSLHFSRTRVPCFWWDYVTPALSVPVWITLEELHFGSSFSGANFMWESALILASSTLVLAWRIPLSRLPMKPRPVLFSIMFLVPVVAAIAIRAKMPFLPE